MEAGKGDVNSSRRKTKFLLTEYGEWEYIGSSRLWVDVSLLSLFAGLMRRQESADTPLHSTEICIADLGRERMELRAVTIQFQRAPKGRSYINQC